MDLNKRSKIKKYLEDEYAYYLRSDRKAAKVFWGG